MRISDWSSDVCSSDLAEDEVDGDNEGRRKIRRRRDEEGDGGEIERDEAVAELRRALASAAVEAVDRLLQPVCSHRSFPFGAGRRSLTQERSEEHTSELQSLMRIPYAVLCFKKK